MNNEFDVLNTISEPTYQPKVEENDILNEIPEIKYVIIHSCVGIRCWPTEN